MNILQIKAEKEGNEDFGRGEAIEYPMDLYIQGVRKEGEGRTVISFRFQTITEPEIASFSVSGDLLLRGTEEEVEAWTVQSTEEPPQVWKYIYRESMSLLAVLAKMIEIPFPVPGIRGVTIDH